MNDSDQDEMMLFCETDDSMDDHVSQAAGKNILGVKDDFSFNDSEPQQVVKVETPRKRRRTVEPPTPEVAEQRRVAREAKKARDEELKRRIIVGIDFGTTFSGIAYVTSSNFWQTVTLVREWNGSHNDILEKVPTRVAYGSENGWSEDRFGYDIEPGHKTAQWVKLKLDPSINPSEFDDELLEKSLGSRLMQLPNNKTAEECCTDFLRYLYHHLFTRLIATIGAATVDSTAITFVITTPATWSIAARHATRQAAMNAGFGSRDRDEIVLIDEPEAAAIAAIKYTQSTFPDSKALEKNTGIMIVDLGGGTVDLISYRLIRLEPLQLEEACVGQGGKCGGTTIDRNLHKLLREWFGHHFAALPPEKVGAGSTFMKAFEDVKRDFKGALPNGKKYTLPLKMRKLDASDPMMVERYDFDEDMVLLTGADLEAMFEPVLIKTYGLIKKQINRVSKAKMPPIRTIIVCGGLGSCAYVQSSLREFIAMEGNIEVISPQRPWSAIVRGAAIAGLEKSPITYRRCRDHLGFPVHEKFDPAKHNARERIDCPIYGARATGQMLWHVSRGEKVSANLKRPIECYMVLEGDQLRKPVIIVEQDLYSCRNKKAAQRLSSKSVQKVSTIRMDVTSLVKSEMKRIREETSAEPQRLQLTIILELTLGADKGTLEVTAKSGKRKLGNVVVEYEADPAYKGKLITEDEDD